MPIGQPRFTSVSPAIVPIQYAYNEAEQVTVATIVST